MEKTGEILKKNLGLEKFKYVKIARALISSIKILFVWYDSRRPTIPLTTHRILNWPYSGMIYSGTELFHGSEKRTVFSPPIPIETFNGMLRGALIITIDFVGNNLIDTRFLSKRFENKENQIKIKYYEIKSIYHGTLIEIIKQILEKNKDEEIREFKESLLEILYEYNIADLRKNAPTPHEKKFLKIRQKQGEQGSFLTDISWNDRNTRGTGKEKYTSTLTCTFEIRPTYKDSQGNYTKKGKKTSTKKSYQIKIQFQSINDWVENRFAFMELTKGEQIEFLRGIIKGADVKIWSDDPSWIFQGHYENAVELDYSLFDWPAGVPHAKGRWAKIKTGSETVPYFSLSKHMIEVLTVIPFIPDEIASMIRKEYGND